MKRQNSLNSSALLLITALLLSACAPSERGISETPVDIAALHARTLTLDTHIDIPLNYMTEIDPASETALQVDLPKLMAGGLDSGKSEFYPR